MATTEWSEPRYEGERHSRVALASERKTDILLVHAKAWPAEFRNHGDNIGRVRAAWTSAASLLGKAIALKEDVEPGEISVGIRHEATHRTADGNKGPYGIFIADNLDNGAGYSSNYSSVPELDALLEYAIDRVGLAFSSESHADKCGSSCYGCLRTYGNRFSHQHLDWRLGLDLLKLLRGDRPSRHPDARYWLALVDHRFARRLAEATRIDDLELTTVNGFQLAISRTREVAFALVHPLWNTDLVDFELARDELVEASGVRAVAFACPYHLQRSPVSEAMRLMESLKGQLRGH